MKTPSLINELSKKTTYVAKAPDQTGNIPWTTEEDGTWKTLITRQTKIVQGRASKEFIRGLDLIDFSVDKIPQHTEINRRLKDFTGWEVVPVPALIPAQEFFTLLSKKQFPAASFIRIPEELDYIQEPDIFHEFYGHVPLMTHSDYATFMEEFGKLALSIPASWRSRLFRLFWFTIEFGLLKEKEGTRAYGGGILSSIHETVYCLGNEPTFMPFNILSTLRTPYRIDIPQPLYFVLEDFQDLFTILDHDIMKLLRESKALGDFPPLFQSAGSEL